ncbi:MAG: hypothetical protein IIC46_06610 [Planctomycetes bacterium]|nr:hypothetical protein [Planctomycetota bacterium]
MSDRALRCAVVGVGRMGAHHARVYSEIEGAELVAVVDPDPARRFKMVYLYHDEKVTNPKKAYAGQVSGGLCMAESPDGIHWTPFAGNPIIPGWFSDVEIMAWDPIDEKYVLWGRYGGMAGESDHPAMDNWFGPVWPADSCHLRVKSAMSKSKRFQ